MMTRKLAVAMAAVLAATAAVPDAAMAHHSAAAFDRSKPLVVGGTLKVFDWTNPHTWITLVVPDGKGGNEEWRLEGPSISILARNGWKRDSIQPGEKIRLLVAPNRDGSKGGEFLTVKKADGTTLKFGIV
ncbi:DUF6152 family protein [Novosphingobium rosa]|uniref:DUF6152 family protein n=1 Tax=Novosphingobium rosa TaxID=76978 RepID=UPI000835BB2D|nr:DUF6152 family protein [Novosphingobium rosa]